MKNAEFLFLHRLKINITSKHNIAKFRILTPIVLNVELQKVIALPILTPEIIQLLTKIPNHLTSNLEWKTTLDC